MWAFLGHSVVLCCQKRCGDVTKFCIHAFHGHQTHVRCHVAGQTSYGCYVKQNRRSSTSMCRCSNRLILLDWKHSTNTSTTTNYANVTYDLLPYNMESATLTTENDSKWRHCHLMYNESCHNLVQKSYAHEWQNYKACQKFGSSNCRY